MFKKLKPNARSDSMERFETLIGPGTTVDGDLMLIDSVRIDGKVVGDIQASTAIDGVSAGAAKDDVIAGATDQGIVGGITGEDVVKGGANQVFNADQQIAAGGPGVLEAAL